MCSASSMEEKGLGTWLRLGIGGNGGGGGGGGGCTTPTRCRSDGGERRPLVQFDVLLPQGVKEETGRDRERGEVGKKAEGARKRMKIADDDGKSSSHGPSASGDGDDDDGGGGTRKKLRLTKEQATLLEDTFRAHNILSHAQKHELARQVNLNPRQVEVWFQNRRARTKLKQTEMDCELLKRCCDSLTDENRRLRHELLELQQSAAAAAGLYAQFRRASATVNVCPSCEKVTAVTSGGGGGETSKSSTSCYS
ncbi:hypothetical protein ACP4OV_013933 [Aristida adscensionis]